MKVTATGQVIYKAEKDTCRTFPDPRGNDLAAGPKRNFQVRDPLDFLAEFIQHIPPKGAHLIRYYGWYSNKGRGLRRKAAEVATAAAQSAASTSDGRRERISSAAQYTETFVANQPSHRSRMGGRQNARKPSSRASWSVILIAAKDPLASRNLRNGRGDSSLRSA